MRGKIKKVSIKSVCKLNSWDKIEMKSYGQSKDSILLGCWEFHIRKLKNVLNFSVKSMGPVFKAFFSCHCQAVD